MIITTQMLENQTKGNFRTGANFHGRIPLSAGKKLIAYLTPTDPMSGETENDIAVFDSEGVDIQVSGRSIEQIGIKVLNYYKKHRKRG